MIAATYARKSDGDEFRSRREELGSAQSSKTE